MIKLIKICKIICIVFVISLFGFLVFSMILTIKNPDQFYEYDLLFNANYYLHEFFLNLAEVALFYLFIKFVEKWCIKNEIE
jgi:hypothetical protein